MLGRVIALSRNFGVVAGLFLGLSSTPAVAQTSCSATERYTLDWDSQTAGAQGTASKVYNATDSGARIENVTVAYTGATGSFASLPIGAGGASVATPYNGVYFTGGIGTGQSVLTLGVDFAGYTTNIDSATNAIGVKFSFASPVRELTYTIIDVDYTAAQYRDWIKVTGLSPTGTTVVPTIASPYPTAGTARNNQTNPGNTAPSTSTIGAVSTPATISNTEVLGVTGASGQNDNFGNVTVTFTSPITEFTVRYGNGPATTMSGTAGLQGIALHDLNFCTMPKIGAVKSSAIITDPISGVVNPKAIPGADVDYSLTIANSGGSPVDLNSTILADILPAEIIFFNGDIDTVTAGTQNYVFTPGTSGLTLSAANISYSNSAGPTYIYGFTPAAGYDANVKALKFAPQGKMAANSSFTIKFRTKIK